MKRIFTILAAVLFSGLTLGQAPQKMSYQSVVRNQNGSLVINTSIGMQISILQGNMMGSAVYIERHFQTTNANGLVTLEIGGGTVVSGNFSAIPWAKGPYFIKSETDLNGGVNYTVSGTSELLSVPYALFCPGTVPAGSIIMYSGTFEFDFTGLGTGNLAGWALCNGNNGTPDIRERFVMGTDSSSAISGIGGKNTLNLTTAQLPPHEHFVGLEHGGHDHTATMSGEGSHQHSVTQGGIQLKWGDNGGVSNNYTESAGGQGGVGGNNILTDHKGDHTHTVYIHGDGAHTHYGYTNPTGSGVPVDIVPAFVKLAYIMKL